MHCSKRIGLFLVLVNIQCGAFLLRNQYRIVTPATTATSEYRNLAFPLYSTTSQKPLYDGTNYTFPDTTTPSGIAEALEVSFVHACMQLRSGYVDVLKLFIAAAMSSYQLGFTVPEIQEALSQCPNESANRPLMPEEVDLRETWYSLVYLLLLSMNHPTTKKESIAASIPSIIREKYKPLVERIIENDAVSDTTMVSVEQLMNDDNVAAAEVADLSLMERAILMQSLRVAALTLVVVREALEAGSGETLRPPTPPIKGAFS